VDYNLKNLNLGQAIRQLFKDIDNANHNIRHFENDTIPSLNADI